MQHRQHGSHIPPTRSLSLIVHDADNRLQARHGSSFIYIHRAASAQTVSSISFPFFVALRYDHSFFKFGFNNEVLCVTPSPDLRERTCTFLFSDFQRTSLIDMKYSHALLKTRNRLLSRAHLSLHQLLCKPSPRASFRTWLTVSSQFFEFKTHVPCVKLSTDLLTVLCV